MIVEDAVHKETQIFELTRGIFAVLSHQNDVCSFTIPFDIKEEVWIELG